MEPIELKNSDEVKKWLLSYDKREDISFDKKKALIKEVNDELLLIEAAMQHIHDHFGIEEIHKRFMDNFFPPARLPMALEIIEKVRTINPTKVTPLLLRVVSPTGPLQDWLNFPEFKQILRDYCFILHEELSKSNPTHLEEVGIDLEGHCSHDKSILFGIDQSLLYINHIINERK